MLRQLTKRNYLGEGFIHQFRDLKTNELLIVPCTKEEYDSLINFSPSKKGYKWEGSTGGTYKVDTPNTILGANEYTIIGEKAVVNLAEGICEEVDKKKIIDDKIDDSNLLNQVTL